MLGVVCDVAMRQMTKPKLASVVFKKEAASLLIVHCSMPIVDDFSKSAM